MSKRFWHGGDVPSEALLDWVDQNVTQALRESWDQEEVYCRIDVDQEGFFIEILGPEYINDNGLHDTFTIKFRLMPEIKNMISVYTNQKGEFIYPQDRPELEEKAKALRGLANAISAFAEHVETIAGNYNESI